MSRVFLAWPAVLAAPLIAAALAVPAAACPFCAATSQTLSEEIDASDVVVLAKLVQRGKPAAPQTEKGPGGSLPGESTFQVAQVLKGQPLLAGSNKVRVLYFGQADPETVFLINGKALPDLQWATPIPLTPRAEKYVLKLPTLPERGGERLAFFQDYLEDPDSVLAQDAYDEFARSPYDDVKELKERMYHDKLVDWIRSPDVSPSHRRLYLTMLGVCGGEKDLPMLEEMLKSSDRRQKAGLDAMIACYLTLKGADGMPLVEELFLKNKKAEYADTYAAIMAIRFHGQEGDVIAKDRLISGLRHMLDREELADLVIADLARWEDWQVMDRLITLFESSDSGSSWVRVPVINYLQVASSQAPDPIKKKAAAAIDELAKIDPGAVRQAKSFGAFGALAQPKPEEKKDPQATETPETKKPQPAAGKSEKPPAPAVPSADKGAAAPRPKPAPANSPAADEEAGEPISGGQVGLFLIAGAGLLVALRFLSQSAANQSTADR